ncbi:WD40 repeat domain-containing protein [Yinghuangia soli]|uniref:WD40 repeat domain-containing protein n=1 Tax=Yinghuangia soli TaxID=2908204 RepID=A0AA41Q8X9_9ACTN|nr:WD40 repeat domain-containing protein [Yinghuangia soli]MCF2533618.1 WD40 repeat domain-containing protein [Yinghuangia soli]
MSALDLTMTLSSPSARPKFCRVAVDGSRLTTSTWAEGRRPRENTQDFASSTAAEAGFAEYRRKKLREGFAYVADPARAVRGDVVLDLRAPHRCTGGFDLSPDGSTLVVASFRDSTNHAELYLIDVATNSRQLIHTESGLVGGQKPLPHAVLFDAAAERIAYMLNGETRLLDVPSGQSRTLATYVQYKDSRFNPFRVRPQWDAERRRLLVFDSGDTARVLDRDAEPVFATSTVRGSADCWAAGLSPSGRLLALCFTSGSAYDAGNPRVVEVEVWDVDRGQLACRLPVDNRPDTIGLDPTDTLLIAGSEHLDGPAAYDPETGELLWYCPDPHRSERWARCHGWAYSPDGKTLAVGGRGETLIVDAATRRHDPAFMRRDEQGGTGRTDLIRFSSDQTLVASGGDNGRIVVRKL